MDRRQFGKLVMGAGAVSATEATDALGQTQGQGQGQAQSQGQPRAMQRMMPAGAADVLSLPSELRPVLEQNYPRFSDAEYARRHRALAKVMEASNVDHVVIVSAQNVGNATRWMTSWPGTTQALLIFKPGEKMTMH